MPQDSAETCTDCLISAASGKEEKTPTFLLSMPLFLFSGFGGFGGSSGGGFGGGFGGFGKQFRS